MSSKRSPAARSSRSAVRVPLTKKTARSFPPPLRGDVLFETIESRVLRNNPLDDPTARTLAVYTPPTGATDGLPLVLHLPGFSGAGWGNFQRPGYLGEPLPQRFERLQRDAGCGPAVIVAPDCLTTLGGSQYVNSSAVGRYEDHLVQEVIPWAQKRFRTGRVGVLGQSSGGFGALHLAFNHPDVFSAAGSSSGDMGFEYCYVPDFPRAVREFRRHGGPEGLLTKLFEDPLIMKSPLDPVGSALNALAMAACYSPRDDEPGTFELPFETESGSLREEVWARWLAFDPVRRVATPEGVAALKRLRLVHITASAPDEWALDVSARWFVEAAQKQGVAIAHDELEGGHGMSGPRFELLYTRMIAALARSSR